jgi:uncharacterized protein YigE (DUF2233 family)
MIARMTLVTGIVLASSALAPSPRVPRGEPLAVAWHAASAGVEMGEVVLPAPSGWRTRVIVARLDPSRIALHVAVARRDDGRGAWSVDSAPRRALLAVNAGQFDSYEPWGWVVRDGAELQPPGTGPLSAAFVVLGDGSARLVAADSVHAVRARGGVRQAIQSYPLLLRDGVMPAQLDAPGRGVDLAHRDARLALGVRRDGRIVVALTRFDALGESLGAVPLGPTVPEMAAIMRDLECESAMLLDGGISAQLLVRDGGATRTWRGFRRVPVALFAVAR